MTPPTCLDDGPRHSWEPTGLDTRPDDQHLVHTARCVWCQREASKPHTATSRPYRAGVRVKP